MPVFSADTDPRKRPPRPHPSGSYPQTEDKVIELIAYKTKANVWVPMHAEYRQVIDATRPPQLAIFEQTLRNDQEIGHSSQLRCCVGR